jgi:hypothetical protein
MIKQSGLKKPNNPQKTKKTTVHAKLVKDKAGSKSTTNSY